MAARGDAWRAWLPALAYMTLIFVISSFEVAFPPANFFPLRDKGIHFVEYTVLGALCAHAVYRTWPRRPVVRLVLFAAFVSTIYGLSDELHQALVPGRSAEVADFIADLLGSVTGAGGYAWWRGDRFLFGSRWNDWRSTRNFAAPRRPGAAKFR